MGNPRVRTRAQPYLHAMLFIHTQQVIRKQRLRDNKEGDEDEEGIDIKEEEE